MTPTRIELPTSFAVGPVNAYLFSEPEIVLVDTGIDSEESWQALQAGFAAQNVAIEDLERIIITHAHVDHLGAAARLARHSEAVIWIADMGYDWLVRPAEKWQARVDYYQQTFLPQAGMPPQALEMVIATMTFIGKGFVPVTADRVKTFQAGDLLQMGGLEWQVLHMPGHARHQTCFYQAETEQFLSADMLLHKTPTPIVEAPLDGRTRIPSLPIYLQSLARVEQLRLKTVHPGHGELITEPYSLIKRQRERILLRKTEALSLVRQGHQTIYELVNIMYAHYPEQARFSGLWMLVGYLDLLLEDELLVVEEVDGVLYYREKGV